MKKLLDSLLLLGRQPIVHSGGTSVVWCPSCTTDDYKIRKTSLDQEESFYALLVRETGSPYAYNRWYSTLVANLLYAKMADRKMTFSMLNDYGEWNMTINARLRQISWATGLPAIRLCFEYGSPIVYASGPLSSDAGYNISARMGAPFHPIMSGREEIIIRSKPEFNLRSICLDIDFVLSCLY